MHSIPCNYTNFQGPHIVPSNNATQKGIYMSTLDYNPLMQLRLPGMSWGLSNH